MLIIRICGFAIPLLLLTWFILRHTDRVRQHRTVAQFVIFAMYQVIRVAYAINRAFDVGYLEYRRVLTDNPPPVENERLLGKVLGQRTPESQY